MAQFARPQSPDISTGGYVRTGGISTDLWQAIDEVTQDDADEVVSPIDPSAAVYEGTLSSVTDPEVSTGHVLRYTYYKGAGGGHTIDMIFRLRQGASTTIAQQTHANVSGTVTVGTLTLSPAEADAITDYTALRFQIESNFPGGGGPGRRGQCTWLEFEVPTLGGAAVPRRHRMLLGVGR